jgi:hypothetical protein
MATFRGGVGCKGSPRGGSSLAGRLRRSRQACRRRMRCLSDAVGSSWRSAPRHERPHTAAGVATCTGRRVAHNISMLLWCSCFSVLPCTFQWFAAVVTPHKVILSPVIAGQVAGPGCMRAVQRSADEPTCHRIVSAFQSWWYVPYAPRVHSAMAWPGLDGLLLCHVPHKILHLRQIPQL